MPYIKQEFRKSARLTPVGPGELNYCITQVILEYLHTSPRTYSTLNEIIGALEQAKDEFQRRVVHPYEDKKRMENGDVYPVL